MWDVADYAFVSYGNTAQYGDGIMYPPGLRVFDLLLGGYKDIAFPLITEGTLTQYFYPGAILATADKKHVYVFQQGTVIRNYVAEIDPLTGAFVRYISAPSDSPLKIGQSFMSAISPDNKFILCLSRKNNAIEFDFQLFDLSTGAWIKTLMAELSDTTDQRRKLMPIFQYPFLDRPEFALDGSKCYIPSYLACSGAGGFAVVGYPCVVELGIPSGLYSDPIIITDAIGKSAMTTMGVTPTPVFSQAVRNTMLTPRSMVASENHPGRVYCFAYTNKAGAGVNRIVVLDFINRTQEIYATADTTVVTFPGFISVLEQDALGADSGVVVVADRYGSVAEYVYNTLAPIYTSPANFVGAGSVGKTVGGRFVVDNDAIYVAYQDPGPGVYSMDILRRRPYQFLNGYLDVWHRLVTPDSPLFVYVRGLTGGIPQTRRSRGEMDMAQDHASGLITIIRSVGTA